MQRSRNVGLARALSKLGYSSRSEATELIRAGRVALNGTPQRNPEYPVNLAQDKISVHGRPVARRKKIYLLLNKPRGVVTTASDEQGRRTIYEFVDQKYPWLAPVGRLDKASEGLLLVTNDSEWAARILDPENHLDKIYHVRIDAHADDALIASLIAGVRSDGELLRAKNARVLRGGKRRAWLEIVLDEGKNRHIRRIFEQGGIRVLRLLRIAIGPLQLGDLAKGSTRPLTQAEKKSLDDALVSRTKAFRAKRSPSNVRQGETGSGSAR